MPGVRNPRFARERRRAGEQKLAALAERVKARQCPPITTRIRRYSDSIFGVRSLQNRHAVRIFSPACAAGSVILLAGCGANSEPTPPASPANVYPELSRWDSDSHYIVDCSPYGGRAMWYEAAETNELATEAAENWDTIWPALRIAYEAMLDDQDYEEAGWGSLEMLSSGEWEFNIETGLNDDRNSAFDILWSLQFIVDGKRTYPAWHVFTEDGEVTHSQPVF